jgi:hypothetical protein
LILSSRLLLLAALLREVLSAKSRSAFVFRLSNSYWTDLRMPQDPAAAVYLFSQVRTRRSTASSSGTGRYAPFRAQVGPRWAATPVGLDRVSPYCPVCDDVRGTDTAARGRVRRGDAGVWISGP